MGDAIGQWQTLPGVSASTKMCSENPVCVFEGCAREDICITLMDSMKHRGLVDFEAQQPDHFYRDEPRVSLKLEGEK